MLHPENAQSTVLSLRREHAMQAASKEKQQNRKRP